LNKKEDVKIEALHVLGSLVEDATCRESLRSLGGIKPIVLILSNVDRGVQKAALKCLEPITFDGDNWKILINNGLVKKLLSFITNQDKEIKQQSIKLLSELTQDNEVKELIVQSGGIKILIESLHDPLSQEAALFSLSCLCSRKDSLNEIVKGGVLQTIFTLNADTIGTQEPAIRIVSALASDESCQAVILKQGLEFLFRLFDSGEEVLQSLTLKCLLILAQNKKNCVVLAQAGTVQRLRNVKPPPTQKALILACDKMIALLS